MTQYQSPLKCSFVQELQSYNRLYQTPIPKKAFGSNISSTLCWQNYRALDRELLQISPDNCCDSELIEGILDQNDFCPQDLYLAQQISANQIDHQLQQKQSCDEIQKMTQTQQAKEMQKIYMETRCVDLFKRNYNLEQNFGDGSIDSFPTAQFMDDQKKDVDPNISCSIRSNKCFTKRKSQIKKSRKIQLIKYFICRNCGAKFKNGQALGGHMSKKHRNSKIKKGKQVIDFNF